MVLAFLFRARAVLVGTLAIIAAEGRAAPLPLVDQNPLLIGIAQPLGVDATFPDAHATNTSAVLNWSNISLIENVGQESLVLDSELQEWRLSIVHALSSNFAMGIGIPYRKLSGGTLDSAIERWHSLLGLPNGTRPMLPQDNFTIDYERAGRSILARSSGYSGIDNLTLAFGYRPTLQSMFDCAVWLNVNLPLGNANPITQSDSTSVSINAFADRPLSSRWHAFARASFTYVEPSGLLQDWQRSTMWAGTIGFDYRATQKLSLTLQFDGHSAAFDSALKPLGSAWILGVGGTYSWSDRWQMQLGIGEDIKVDASPDVTFILAITNRTGR